MKRTAGKKAPNRTKSNSGCYIFVAEGRTERRSFPAKVELPFLQEMVGGYIEIVAGVFPKNIVAVINDRAKLDGLPASIMVLGDVIPGPVIICGDSEEGVIPLTPHQAAYMERILAVNMQLPDCVRAPLFSLMDPETGEPIPGTERWVEFESWSASGRGPSGA